MNNNFEFATGLNSNIGNQFSGNATQNPTQQNVYQTQANNQMNGAQPTNNGFAADNDLTMGENYYEEKPSTFKKIILPLALIIIAVALIIWAITRIAQNGYEEVTVEMVDLEIEQMVVPITDEVNIEEIASVEEVGVTAPAIPTPLPTVVNQPTAIQTPAPQVVQTGRLTGRVNLTGHVPSNSSILVLWRHPGENDFRVVTRLEARNGVTWTWDGAQAGRTYEIRLAFQVNDNNRNVSNIVSATAPANIELTLNTGEDNRRTVSGPTHTPVLENCGDRNGNYWRARIVLPRVDNARGYWVTMGTYQNGRNTLDRRMDGEGRQVVYVNVRNDREYFVRYAVRTNGDFGSFGATLRFRCSGTARSSSSNNLDFNDFSGFRGFRCDRDNRRCVTTQDHNAPFPNTRDGLDRCLSECN